MVKDARPVDALKGVGPEEVPLGLGEVLGQVGGTVAVVVGQRSADGRESAPHH